MRTTSSSFVSNDIDGSNNLCFFPMPVLDEIAVVIDGHDNSPSLLPLLFELVVVVDDVANGDALRFIDMPFAFDLMAVSGLLRPLDTDDIWLFISFGSSLLEHGNDDKEEFDVDDTNGMLTPR
jgi:hypothetical protein